MDELMGLEMQDLDAAVAAQARKGLDVIAEQLNSEIKAALNAVMPKDLTAADASLRCSVQGNPDELSVLCFDGKPILEFGPLRYETVSDDAPSRLTCFRHFRRLYRNTDQYEHRLTMDGNRSNLSVSR